MSAEWCECGQPLNSERNKRLDMCRFCERLERLRIIEESSGFVENQPTLRYEDGLIYIIERQPEFDD